MRDGKFAGSARQFIRVKQRFSCGYLKLLVLTLAVLAGQAHAGTFTVFGPETYVRESGAPFQDISNFDIAHPGAYTLTVYNGGLEDDGVTGESVSSSVIRLNGEQILGPNEFNQNVNVLTKPIQLLAQNAFSVELRGKPGGLLYILIEGEDNDDPTIDITAPPAFVVGDSQPDIVIEYADAPAGVDLTSLSVTLDGNDISGSCVVGATSATCSPGVLAYGAHQVMASITDLAGNTASDTHDFVLNSPPTAMDDAASTDEDVAATITTADLLLNDEDPDDPDTQTVVSVQNAVNGAVAVNGDITFTPNADFNGTASFEYTMEDQGGLQSSATVNVTVNPVNDAPTADNQPVVTDEDVAVNITLSGGDVDGDGLAFSVATGPGNGALSGTAPNLTYTPNLNNYGTDSFTFVANDGTLNSLPATISITINPVNDAPTAADQSVVTDQDMAVNITLSGGDVDGDGLAFSVATGPSNGTLSGTAPSLIYTPTANYFGPDSFTFLANDGTLNSDPATVSITVEPTTPTAVDDAFQTPEDTPIVIDGTQLLANDANLEYTNLPATTPYAASILPDEDIANGEVITTYTLATVNGIGVIFYHYEFVPAPNFSGIVSFPYTLYQGSQPLNTATITIDVTPVADEPTLTVHDRETMELLPVSVGEAALVDTDGSETLSFVVDGVPETWTVSGATVTPPAGAAAQSYSLLVTAIATETANGDTATAGPETVIVSVLVGIDLGTGATEISTNLPGELAGYSVDIVGDLNGDGLDELFIGAPQAEPEGKIQQGRAYLVHGAAEGMSINLADTLSGTNGFTFIGERGGNSMSATAVGTSRLRFPGPRGDGFGFAVNRAGDVNGDGVEDLFASAPYAKGDHIYQGKSYLWFGDPTNTSDVLTSDIALDSNASGFRILGLRGADLSRDSGPVSKSQDGDLAGWSIDSMRDFNGDGLADLLVSALDHGDANQGRIHVVLGKEDGAEILLSELADESNTGGFVVDADNFNSEVLDIEYGRYARSIGDFNGDGLTDFVFVKNLISNGPPVHIIWGKEDVANIVLPIGSGHVGNNPAGFTLPIGEGLTLFSDVTYVYHPVTGLAIGVSAGHSFSGADSRGGGDVNGDGYTDVVLGGSGASENGTSGFFHQNLVGFGYTGIDSISVSDIMSGSNGAGFVIKSNEKADAWKNETTIIGDVNGDGFDDILTGANRSSANANLIGKAFVVFGKADTTPVNLSDVAFGNGGFVLLGEPESGRAGFAVSSSGDVNGDGLADILVGAPYVDVDGQADAGKTYLVYGGVVSSAVTHQGTTGDDDLTGDAGVNNFAGGLGDDLMVGNGGADVYYGGAGNDTMVVADASFRRAYGGNGTDTLALAGDGMAVDLSTDAGRLDGIEQIDLGATGNQTLILSRLALLNLSPNSNTLVVYGGLGTDLVQTLEGDQWVNEGAEVISARTFTKYTDGRAILYVETMIDTQIAPVIPAQTHYIDENSANGTSAGTVLAIDGDGGTLSNFLITGGDPGNVFQMNAATGEVTLAGSLDFETTSAYSLTVQVNDNDGLLGVGIVDIAVNDINEAPVIAQSHVTLPVAEHTSTGKVIATVNASDVDADDVLTFALGDSLSGPAFTDSAGFAIDSASGAIYVSNAALIDFETDDNRDFSVNVTDTGALSATAIPVQITLTDVTSFVAPFSFTLATQTPQSLWEDTSALYDPDPIVYSLQRQIGSPFTVSYGLGDVTFDMGIDTSISADISSESGDVSASLPFTVNVTVPDEVQLGVPFVLQSSFVLGAEASISGNSASFASSVQADIKNLAAMASITGLVNGTIFDVQVDDFEFQRAYGGGPVTYTGSPTSMGSRELKIPAPISVQVFEETDFATAYLTELNDRGIPNDGFGNIRFFIPLSIDEIDIYYTSVSTGDTGTINLIQDLALLVDALKGTVTFEDGTQIVGWNIDDDLEVTLDASADVNPPDGRVDFDITFSVESTFSTTSQHSLTMRHDIDAGEFSVRRINNSENPPTVTQLAQFGPLVDVFAEVSQASDPEVRSFTLGSFNTHTGIGAFDLGVAAASSATSSSSSIVKTTEPDADETDSDGQLNSTVYEKVVPLGMAGENVHAARADAPLTLRLRGDSAIDMNSITATLPDGYTTENTTVEWMPVAGGDLRDIWVIFRNALNWYFDQQVSASTSALTQKGERVEADAQFQVESQAAFDARQAEPVVGIWQPEPGVDYAVGDLTEAEVANGELVVTQGADAPALDIAVAAGAPVSIGADRVFMQAQRVWFPVPAGIAPSDVKLYYYHFTSDDEGWYRAESVEDWLVPDSFLQLNIGETNYIGFMVRHPGIAQLGVPLE